MSGGNKTPINELVLIPKIAPLLALGKSTTDIASTLNIGFNTVRKLCQKDETKQLVREITDSYKDVAKAYCARAISEMNELSMEGLRKALKDGNIHAIRTHLQVIGLLGVEEQGKQQAGGGTLNIIMPGAQVGTTEVIDVGAITERELVRPDHGGGGGADISGPGTEYAGVGHTEPSGDSV